MRITGGTFSGRKLLAPTQHDTRPMRDAVRMALFNILGTAVEGVRFLDLFAGTGGVGLEALSRGAAQATFVENLPAALDVLRQNVVQLGVEDRAEVVAQDVFRALLTPRLAFKLAFVGAPYGKGLAHRALGALQPAQLAPDAVVVAEVFYKEPLEADYGLLHQVDRRRYGDNLLVFFQAGAR